METKNNHTRRKFFAYTAITAVSGFILNLFPRKLFTASIQNDTTKGFNIKPHPQAVKRSGTNFKSMKTENN